MGDLISRRALLKELRRELRECRKDGEEFGGESILWAEGIEFAIDTVKHEKPVDAVEVVRCKDCAWYSGEERICTNSHCTKSYYGCRVREEHFCSFGERREQDE